MLVSLYSCLLKLSITLFTPKTATPPAHSPTPYKVRFNKKPDIFRLCPFSCKAYVYDHSPNRKKLSPHAFEGIFVGYADSQKAYRIYSRQQNPYNVLYLWKD